MISLRRLLCRAGLHSYETVRDTIIHRYQRCRKCGNRRVVRTPFGGYQPVDRGWVETGEWTPPPEPPSRGSAVVRPDKDTTND